MWIELALIKCDLFQQWKFEKLWTSKNDSTLRVVNMMCGTSFRSLLYAWIVNIHFVHAHSNCEKAMTISWKVLKVLKCEPFFDLFFQLEIGIDHGWYNSVVCACSENLLRVRTWSIANGYKMVFEWKKSNRFVLANTNVHFNNGIRFVRSNNSIWIR